MPSRQNPFDRQAGYWLAKRDLPASLAAVIDGLAGANKTLLDLGCGGGRLAAAYADRFVKVIGIDRAADLVEQAARQHPQVRFICGDYGRAEAWFEIGGPVDVVASNCALRRDYCPRLDDVARLSHQQLVPGGAIVHWIQGRDDLATVLPPELRASLFFDEDELRRAFADFSDLAIERFSYRQRFSSVAYVRTFLERIDIHGVGEIRDRSPARQFYLLRGRN